MWCPACGAEYVEGVRVCADDGTPLVARLQEEPSRPDPGVRPAPDNVDVQTAFLGRFDPLAVPVLLDLLRERGIFALSKLPSTEPNVSEAYLFPSGAGDVLVDRARLDEARRIADVHLPAVLAEMSEAVDREFQESEPE